MEIISTERFETPEAGPMLPPVPAVVLGVKGDSTIKDALSVAWTFVLEGHPPLVGISVTNKTDTTGTPYYINELIKKHGEFTLNVPDSSWVKEFDDIDMSGHKWEDKFAENGRLNSSSRIFFGMTAGNGEFWTFGNKIGHIGMTKDRDDIKY